MEGLKPQFSTVVGNVESPVFNRLPYRFVMAEKKVAMVEMNEKDGGLLCFCNFLEEVHAFDD